MAKKKSEKKYQYKTNDDLYISLLKDYISNEKYSLKNAQRIIEEMTPVRTINPRRYEEHQYDIQLYKKLLKEDQQKLRDYQKLKPYDRKKMLPIIKKEHPALF